MEQDRPPDEPLPNRPPWYLKAGFWMLLGMLSTYFAEVVSGSDPFPFERPWGLLVTTPLYTLHILVLATVLVRYRMLTWQGLCFAGGIFGLYEGYITKVLWDPTWAPEMTLRAGGLSWPHTVILVLWWHPMMAFALPLLAAESFLTRSRTVLDCLPLGMRNFLAEAGGPTLWAAAAALACGTFTGGGPHGTAAIIGSTLANSALLLALIGAWRRWTSGKRHTLAELLPGKRGFRVLALLLAAFYGLTGALLRPGSLPAPPGHITIALLYLAFAFGLYRCRQLSRELPAARVETGVTTFVPVCTFAATYVLVATAIKPVLGPFSGVFPLLNLVVGSLAGLFVYTCAFKSVIIRANRLRDRHQAHAHSG